MIIREYNRDKVPLRDMNMAMEKLNMLDTQQRKTKAYKAEINSSTYSRRVDKIVAGDNVTIYPVEGVGTVTITAEPGGVTQLIAGTLITLSPSNGEGVVTINGTAEIPTGGYPYNYLTRNSVGALIFDVIRAHG